jgi:hypothetical protein
VADGKGGGENTEDEERLSGPLVLDVVGDGVLDESELREHLREDEAEEDECIRGLTCGARGTVVRGGGASAERCGGRGGAVVGGAAAGVGDGGVGGGGGGGGGGPMA